MTEDQQDAVETLRLAMGDVCRAFTGGREVDALIVLAHAIDYVVEDYYGGMTSAYCRLDRHGACEVSGCACVCHEDYRVEAMR